MKFSSPRNLALVVSLVVTALTTGIVAFSLNGISQQKYLLLVGAVALSTFGLSYAVYYLSVERFLYKHVKLLYRTLQFQKTPEAGNYEVDMNKDVLGEVETEVSKWATSRRQEIDELQEEAEFRREFLGNLSHELKTPIFNIQGYILTLLEGGLEDPSINRNYLERAAKGVDRVTNILEDLDTITRIESGQMQIDMEKFDLVELAKDIIEAMEMKAQRFKVEIKLKEDYSELMVNADPSRIGQIFTNLLNNAIKYNKEDGEVEIRLYDTPENIMVEIADNGVGIASEHLPRLFERFYRVEKSRSRDIGGTGIGLAIVKHIIEAHDQTITVRSTEEVGTTFTFTLARA